MVDGLPHNVCRQEPASHFQLLCHNSPRFSWGLFTMGLAVLAVLPQVMCDRQAVMVCETHHIAVCYTYYAYVT